MLLIEHFILTCYDNELSASKTDYYVATVLINPMTINCIYSFIKM